MNYFDNLFGYLIVAYGIYHFIYKDFIRSSEKWRGESSLTKSAPDVVEEAVSELIKEIDNLIEQPQPT